MTPETKVKNKITKYLDSLNIYWERRQALGIAYKKGLPDLFAILDGGIHVEIEVKAKDGTPSIAQIRWKDTFNDKQIPYIICYSFDDFKIKMSELLSSLA